MFIERLSKQDWEEYAKDVICGENYNIASNIYIENETDKMGNVESTYLNFIAVGEQMDDEYPVDMVVTDFENDMDHKKFFINKFGLSYIHGYKRYLKTLDISDKEKNKLFKDCNTYYNEITHNPNDHQTQKSLDDYTDVMVR